VPDQSEALVQAGLQEAARGRTTLVIAHRLSTLRAVDRIVVLDHGRVVESGAYDELLARGGHFARLVSGGLHDRPSASE
jgi:ABC-type multidrug transport system fused ATPase/permease subunit